MKSLELATALLCLAGAGCDGAGATPDDSPAPVSAPGSGRGPDEKTAAQELPPLVSFRGTSSVVFVAAPDLPHTLDFSYEAPDRARWELRLDGKTNRMLEYRFGGRFFRVEDFVRESAELEGSQREVQALQMDLRRAVFQWPHGFEWTTGEAPELRVATVPALVDDPEAPPLGTLTATLHPDGELDSILAATHLGIGLQRLRVEAWHEPPAGSRAHRRPARLTLHEGDRALWAEDVREFSGTLRVKAGFFLPPDREELAQEPADGDADGDAGQ